MLRTLADSQISQILVGGPGIAEPELLFETSDVLVEAPNWSRDGSALYLNGAGVLWRLDLANPAAGLIEIVHVGLPPINNDHVLDPDGQHIFMSANDGHIYRGSLAGGEVARVTPDDGRWHFLHGVSPDGARLAYVDLGSFEDAGRLMILPSEGGEPVLKPTGAGHLDGPEWTPDGEWILYNTESFTTAPGHAQLARIGDAGHGVSFAPAGADDGAPERLVFSDTVDWFPHASPDGAWASYISFPPGTLGHPADLDVVVKVVSTSDWSTPTREYSLFGGQGTLNVNSWSPDSARFAFVAYPVGT